MIHTILVSLSLLAIAPAISEAGHQIRHLELNKAYLIDTGAANWAISSPTLAQNSWRTVSLNGEKVVIWSAQCQTSVKTPQGLSSAEKTLINNIRDQLNNGQVMSVAKAANVQAPGRTQSQINLANKHSMLAPQQRIPDQQQQPIIHQSNYAYSSTIDGTQSQLVADHPIDTLSYDNQQITMNKGSESFSISKQGLPNNLAQVFVDNDLITYVYLNGEVLMKPTACLQSDELEFMKKLKAEVQQSQKHMEQYWTTFNQNMQSDMFNVQQNMHQGMQQAMNQNLMNMLPNIYPFQHQQQQQQHAYANQLYQTPDYGSQQIGSQLGPYYSQYQQPLAWMNTQMQPRSASGFAQATAAPNFFSNNMPFAQPQSPFPNMFNQFGATFPFYGSF